MSARRDARAQVALPLRGRRAVPASLMLGPCTEVWAEDPDGPGTPISARSRWGRAWDGWAASQGYDFYKGRELRRTASSHLFSVRYMAATYSDGAERALARFSAIGCDFDDIADLRAEAERLVKKVPSPERNRG